MPLRSSDSCSDMSAPMATRSGGRRSGSLQRISRAMSCGWPRPDRIAAIIEAWEPCRIRYPSGWASTMPRSMGRGLSAATSTAARTSGLLPSSHMKPRSQR